MSDAPRPWDIFDPRNWRIAGTSRATPLASIEPDADREVLRECPGCVIGPPTYTINGQPAQEFVRERFPGADSVCIPMGDATLTVYPDDRFEPITLKADRLVMGEHGIRREKTIDTTFVTETQCEPPKLPQPVDEYDERGNLLPRKIERHG